MCSRAGSTTSALVTGDGIAGLEEQVGAEERPLGPVEEQAGVPAVRHVRRGEELDAVAAGLEDLAVGEGADLAVGEIVEHHELADEAAHRLGPGRYLEPFVERSALVGLEVAEPDPAYRRRDRSPEPPRRA